MTNSPKHNYPRQPAHIQPYVAVLGIEDTIRFLLTFGGAELYLTTTPKGRSRLAQMFGVEKAAAVAQAAEHMPRRVPTAKPWIAQVWSAQGQSVAEVARTLHVSDVTVRGWLKRRLEGAVEGSFEGRFDERQPRLI